MLTEALQAVRRVSKDLREVYEAAYTLLSCPGPRPAAWRAPGTATVVCGYTGAAQYWAVPGWVTRATFTLYGAQGGAANSSTPGGGLGAEVTSTLTVVPGAVLQRHQEQTDPARRRHG